MRRAALAETEDCWPWKKRETSLENAITKRIKNFAIDVSELKQMLGHCGMVLRASELRKLTLYFAYKKWL